MAFNNYAPFWDFVRGFDQEGAGVDHTSSPGFPGVHPHQPPPHFFGSSPWGPTFRGFHPPHPSRSYQPHFDAGRAESHVRGSCGPDGCEPGTAEANTSGEARQEGEWRPNRGPRGSRGRGRHHDRFPNQPPPPFGHSVGHPGAGFDLTAFLGSLSGHPLAQALRTWAEQAEQAAAGSAENAGNADEDAENAFVPPVDIFSTETRYVLHVAIPGAKKEDVGINYDPEKMELNLAGVVYRQGDEEFLKTLTKAERKVGVFERLVKLPLGRNEEKVEIDSDAISAKLEDGVLVVTVPKVEKEWTEVKRVDIE